MPVSHICLMFFSHTHPYTCKYAHTQCILTQGGLQQFPKCPYMRICYSSFLIDCRQQQLGGSAQLDLARKMYPNLSYRCVKMCVFIENCLCASVCTCMCECMCKAVYVDLSVCVNVCLCTHVCVYTRACCSVRDSLHINWLLAHQWN